MAGDQTEGENEKKNIKIPARRKINTVNLSLMAIFKARNCTKAIQKMRFGFCRWEGEE